MKIVGIVLLSILALLVLILVLVLFVPFTYRIRGSCHGKAFRLHARVFVLAALLGFVVRMEDGEWNIYLRICGIKKRLGEEKKKQKIAESKPAEEPAVKAVKIEDLAAEEPASEGWEQVSDEPAPEPKPSIFEKIASIPQKLRELWQKLTDAVRSFRQTAGRVAELVKDEGNQRAVRFLCGKLFQLLKYLTPTKLRLSMAYSTGSPDTTGQVMGVLALFPLAYKNRWDITPDFEAEEFFVETDFDVRGHIFGIQILCVAVGILLDKDCQKLYNKIS